MYFKFDEDRPEAPALSRPFSGREGVMMSIIVHLFIVIVLLVAPELPWVKAAAERQRQAIEEAQKVALEQAKQQPRFVFVQPRLDRPAPKPPPRAELSDIDRTARTVARAERPTNSLPFARGNTSERIDANTPTEAPAAPQPEPSPAAPPAETSASNLPRLPQGPSAFERPSERPAEVKPTPGVLADAIRNVQKYAQRESFNNPTGGRGQDIAPSIQFDTKGVEFGPWLRRFIAQIRSNWFIPYAAMSMKGNVVLQFNVHKDGRITDVTVARPSNVNAFTASARNAILASNPTVALPPEYPDNHAFFTVTFYFNEEPDR